MRLRKLEEVGYLESEKRCLDRKPLTRARLTPAGRKAFRSYLDAVRRLVGEGPG